MYASLNRDQLMEPQPGNTKYTDYLKTLSSDPAVYDGGGGGSYTKSDRKSHALLPLNNEVKFSNIFSPRESNALKLQLLQKTASLPLLDQNNSNGSGLLGELSSDTSRLISRRRSTASGIVHGPQNLRKGDSVANILYSTLRHGHEYDNPSADETLNTGSDSKVDYDPHEPLPQVDQIALRHELLNNIRAISRATYFEDLYTGKVRRNSGSPEAEILRLLENPQETTIRTPIVSTNDNNTIPSKDASLSRVDRWVKESSEASSRAQNETDEEIKEETSSKQDQSSSLYHQSVWKEETKRNKKEPIRTKTKPKKTGIVESTDDSYTESDVETASQYMARTSQYKSTKFNPKNDKSNKTFSRNTDNSTITNSTVYLPPPSGIIPETTSQYLQKKYLTPGGTGTTLDVGKKRPYSFGLNGSDDGIPLSLSLPNVAQKTHTPVALHSSYKSQSYSRPENLNLTPAVTKAKSRNNTEQVRRILPPQQQHQPQQQLQPTQFANTGPRRNNDGASNRGGGGMKRVSRPDRKVPGIYTRLNINQWPMKKVTFYVNGDEHYPKFEYRFRYGKDIRDLDQLLDLLTKRFPILPTGARYIFAMDGFPINSLEEIENDNSYVVSSTRKFKALKYGSESENDIVPEVKRNVRNNGEATIRRHPPLSRELSVSDGNLTRRSRRGVGGGIMEKSMSSLNSKSVSDVPKLVAHVIHEASSSSTSTSNSSPIARQPVRVINGSKPSIQSQVLLNTKTSQPFEDLVRDLGMSVRVPKQPIGSRLETLAGRPIRSYSQLRSELKAGQRAFYIYSDQPSEDNLNKGVSKTNRNRNGKPLVKAMLGKVNSDSSSDLSISELNKDSRERRHRKRSQTPLGVPRSRSIPRMPQPRPTTYTVVKDEWN